MRDERQDLRVLERNMQARLEKEKVNGVHHKQTMAQATNLKAMMLPDLGMLNILNLIGHRTVSFRQGHIAKEYCKTHTQNYSELPV